MGKGLIRALEKKVLTVQCFRGENDSFGCLLVLEHPKVEHHENRLKSGTLKMKMLYLCCDACSQEAGETEPLLFSWRIKHKINKYTNLRWWLRKKKINKKSSGDTLANTKLQITLLCCRTSTSSLSDLPPTDPHSCTKLSSLQVNLSCQRMSLFPCGFKCWEVDGIYLSQSLHVIVTGYSEVLCDCDSKLLFFDRMEGQTAGC